MIVVLFSVTVVASSCCGSDNGLQKIIITADPTTSWACFIQTRTSRVTIVEVSSSHPIHIHIQFAPLNNKLIKCGLSECLVYNRTFTLDILNNSAPWYSEQMVAQIVLIILCIFNQNYRSVSFFSKIDRGKHDCPNGTLRLLKILKGQRWNRTSIASLH